VGRAWSGRAAIKEVDLSVDGGATWDSADLAARQDVYAWQSWRYQWRASVAGTYELLCRARDETGEVQPVEQHWTARGMGNNMAQRVPVQVI